MALITKMLDVAINDCDAGRISSVQLASIFQEAIDNGDILEEQNELAVVLLMPLVDQGIVRSSEHLCEFEARMNAQLTQAARDLRTQERRRPWWKFWGRDESR